MSYKLRTTPAMELKLAKIKRFCEKQENKKRNGNDMLLATISKSSEQYKHFYNSTVRSRMDNVSDSLLQNCRNKLMKKVH